MCMHAHFQLSSQQEMEAQAEWEVAGGVVKVVEVGQMQQAYGEAWGVQEAWSGWNIASCRLQAAVRHSLSARPVLCLRVSLRLDLGCC